MPGQEGISWNPPESTYKTCTLPLPAASKPGESWRLALHLGPTPSQIDVSHYALPNPHIISVWSEPIHLVRGEPSSAGGIVRGVGADAAKGKKGDKKGKGAGGAAGKGKEEEGRKQGRITRDWTLGKRRLSIIEQTSFDLDKVG